MAIAKKKKDVDWGNFEEVDRSLTQNIIWASEGEGGSGKTHFGLSAPDPIAVHLFDPGGLKGLTRNALFRKKDIRVVQYNFNLGQTAMEDRPKAAKDALDQFLENQQNALMNAKTILWDKEDYVWEMLRYARLEAVSDRPSSYYELNLEYRGWFHDAEFAGVNMGVIRGMKEKWGVNAKGSPVGTGQMEPRGQREVPELVQVVLRHRWDNEAKEFMTTIHDKCRLGPNAKDLIGQEFSGLDYDTLSAMIFAGEGDEEEDE